MTGNGRTLREILERTEQIREPLDGPRDAEGRYARLGTVPATPVRIEPPEDGDWIMTRRLRKAVLEAQ